MEAWISKVVGSTRRLIKNTGVITNKDVDLSFHLTTDPELQKTVSSNVTDLLDLEKSLIASTASICGKEVPSSLISNLSVRLIENDYEQLMECFDGWIETLVRKPTL